MTIKIASLKADLKREEEGDWIDYPDWPGVAFNVSSLNAPAYVCDFATMSKRLSKTYKGQPIPPSVSSKEVGRLFCKHLLHDWRGLDVAYSPETAVELLTDPAYRKLITAVEWCAEQVAETQIEFTEDAAKNLERPSAGS